jgi:hypothetical protein
LGVSMLGRCGERGGRRAAPSWHAVCCLWRSRAHLKMRRRLGSAMLAVRRVRAAACGAARRGVVVDRQQASRLAGARVVLLDSDALSASRLASTPQAPPTLAPLLHTPPRPACRPPRVVAPPTRPRRPPPPPPPSPPSWPPPPLRPRPPFATSPTRRRARSARCARSTAD